MYQLYIFGIFPAKKAKKSCGETKHSRRSPLDHGYVAGIGEAYRSLTPLSHGAGSVPYLLCTVESHSLLPTWSHVVHGVNVKG